MILVEDVLTRI